MWLIKITYKSYQFQALIVLFIMVQIIFMCDMISGFILLFQNAGGRLAWILARLARMTKGWGKKIILN